VTVSGVDSVRVCVHLYERRFRAKPVMRVLRDRRWRVHGARDRRHTRRCRGHTAVLPDDDDTHSGRERPPQNQARDRDRGVAEGVAHAPDASATAADNRAHCETGGTERRPVHRNEVAHCKEHRQINAADNDVDQAAQLSTNSSPGGGNTAPASVFPPSWRTFIRKLRILGGVEFIEAPTFTAIVAGYLEDDEYRALQLFLAGDPEAGDVMPGTGGFRKLRWADRRRGKGKRGGLRVIYYHLSADAQIWLMTLYDKDEMADLSAAEKRALKAALDAELARRAARRRLRRK
jgi:hypothetical protein